jgi:hypothetical protein
MTSLTRKLLSLVTLCAIGLPMAAFIVGCKEEEPPPPPPPPPPKGPTTVDPNSVAEYLTLDSKVNLQNAKPMECSEEEVKAILQFMSDFAAGNAEALRPRMDSTGKKVLDELVESGQWKEETSRIVEVDLVDRIPMPTSGGNVVSFSVVMPEAGRVQQDWLVTQRGDTYTFAPFAVVPVSQQSLEAAKKATEDASGEEGKDANQPDAPTSPDPRKRVPKPTDPDSPPPGKGPGSP